MSRYDRKMQEQIFQAKRKMPRREPKAEPIPDPFWGMGMGSIRGRTAEFIIMDDVEAEDSIVIGKEALKRLASYWDSKVAEVLITGSAIIETGRGGPKIDPYAPPYPEEWKKVHQSELEWYIGEVKKGVFEDWYVRKFQTVTLAPMKYSYDADTRIEPTDITYDVVTIPAYEVRQWLDERERRKREALSGWRKPSPCDCPMCRGSDFRTPDMYYLSSDMVSFLTKLGRMAVEEAKAERDASGKKLPEVNHTLPEDTYDPWNPRRITK